MSARPARKLAIVTGGAQGLGLGVARRLLDDGCSVAILDIQERLSPEAERALGPARPWRFFSADVSDERRIRDIERELSAAEGSVAFLVNNAGIFPRYDSATLPLDTWNRILAVNLTGTFLCCQVFGQSMRQGGGGAIINVSSGRAIQPAPRGAAYSASKAGIIALTRTLAFEWAPDNIRVNCLVPGISDTAQPRQDMTDEQLQAAAQRVPLRRLGQPADMAAAVAFLLSDEAAYITGQCLAVNGGAIMM
jgi:NAD(P)-dependent dehydrogenase (short-subunit alcohol dehydrogenase family)